MCIQAGFIVVFLTQRSSGFNGPAEWFETLAKAEKSHAGRFSKGFSQIAGKEPAEVAV